MQGLALKSWSQNAVILAFRVQLMVCFVHECIFRMQGQIPRLASAV